MAAGDFSDTLRQAIEDVVERGFDSPEQIARWMERLREAGRRSFASEQDLRNMLDESLRAIYRRLVEKGGAIRLHPGISKYTLMQVQPKLRRELDSRILASAALIKLSRDEAIEKTLRRFAGWATSIPKGGSDAAKRGETKAAVAKALRQLPFEERRVLIDQGHKLNASLSQIIATDSGAIAAIWRSHYRQAGYDYRPDHKDRDGKVYLVRGSWAQGRGLVKVGPDGYTDAITQPAEEPFCRCFWTWLYSLRDIAREAPELLTAAGKAEFERVRVA
jgi:hypothetical protein